MEKTLEKVIQENDNGLFLFDAPTGFGKTTSVINIIKKFLSGDPSYNKIKRMFFVTNLLTNLPYDKLMKLLTSEEKKQCFRAKATVDYLLENLVGLKITNKEVINSDEYKNLLKDVESYKFLLDKLSIDSSEEKNGYRDSIKILKEKISTDTEPSFRNYLKNLFIYNKSIHERMEFIKNNEWFVKLYPICSMNNYKVIFLTTKKFISPMDTFLRLPFYVYCDDELVKDSVVFIDEFDATKQEFLNQIIEDGYKAKVDVVSLFLNIHYSLQNLIIPKKILKTSDYHKKKVDNKEWYTTESHFNYWKNKFNEKYKKYQINYLFKSKNFNTEKSFLFDDGEYITVIKNSSNKYIYAEKDQDEGLIFLKALSNKREDLPLINNIIRELQYCIDGFSKSLHNIANNYLYYNNQNKNSYETKYTFEESLYTILNILNLSNDEKDYLFEKIQKEDYIDNKILQNEEVRKGFNFTEIEDSNYHDMKSVIRNYSFPTTPEDALLKLTSRALVIGISATAKIETCIGNYDLNYLQKKLGDSLISIDSVDEERIINSFKMMEDENRGKYKIHVDLVDNFTIFSNRILSETLIKKIFNEPISISYKEILDNLKDNEIYYFNIELKLAYFYKKIIENNIKSSIAFVNKFPKDNDFFNIKRLNQIFSEINKLYNNNQIYYKVIGSQNFDEKFEEVKKLLETGEQVMIITTYQTIGSGKNLQYLIPKGQEAKNVNYDDDSNKFKDFEALYLCMSTNLLQTLDFKLQDKYTHLAKYFFQQEYLYKNKYIAYQKMKKNIENAFRVLFFGDCKSRKNILNFDYFFHVLKISIQAVGRICRCRNKNKDVYIFADVELLRNIQAACDKKMPKLLNEEFMQLLNAKINEARFENEIALYSKINQQAHRIMNIAAYTVRNSEDNIKNWKRIREYVLQFPTTDMVWDNYKNLYFKMKENVNEYSYKQNKMYGISDITLENREDYQHVSESECKLKTIMSIKFIRNMFKEKKYAQNFEENKFIMSPVLFKQIYLGALGEVVGKCILEYYLGIKLKDLEDKSFYEYFDFKLDNYYFDFKHWDEYIVNNDEYVKKIENKLKKINGAKCFVINIIKNCNSPIKVNVGETVIQVPYLIDDETNSVNEEIIHKLIKIIC